MILIPPIEIDETTLAASSVADDPPYSPATSYTVGQRVRVGALPAAETYECVQAPALDKNPATQPLFWMPLGRSRRWAMFDDSVQTATTSSGTLSFTVVPVRRVSSVVLMGLVGTSVTLTVRDGAAGPVLYTQTRVLLASSGTYYSWFFEDAYQVSDAFWFGLPVSPSAHIEVSITPAAGVAACGLCKMGREQYIGDAEYGADVGTEQRGKDFLDKQGNPVTSERGFSRTLTCTLHIPLTDFNRVNRLFEAQVQAPAVWVIAPGMSDYESAIVYGRYQRAVRVMAGPTHAMVSLEVAGYR